MLAPLLGHDVGCLTLHLDHDLQVLGLSIELVQPVKFLDVLFSFSLTFCIAIFGR